jgi:type I restriction-modification system DNA methylase subunit
MRQDANRSLFEAVEKNRPSAVYGPIYEGLAALREEFHRTGRLDDSNAKLDEVVKLFATYLAFKLGDIPGFPEPVSHPGPDFVAQLQHCYAKAALQPYFVSAGGVSIFGTTPSLVLRDDDAGLAVRLIRLVVRAVDDAFSHQEDGNPYDVLNEAFGHFVRDNFRGNIEDAQYLTPAEVVDFMTSIALEDIQRDSRLSDRESLIVADPCCGVGSFLTAFAAKYRTLNNKGLPHLKLFGQDKVERMARLTTVNLALFRVFDHSVSVGNSIFKGSSLDEMNGSVDLILTNPPFGARFAQNEIALMARENTPFFSMLGRTRGPIESELLFVDRDLRLLREGGLLLIVVPDGVISASGIAALLRHHLRTSATLRGVIELPSVTFAQAGTRTKTAVLYLKKESSASNDLKHVFMGASTDLGFRVNSRKGVQIKVRKGESDLPAMLSAYRSMQNNNISKSTTVLSQVPQAVAVLHSSLHDVWTPGHYQAMRHEDINDLTDTQEILNSHLDDLVDFVADERRVQKYRPGCAFLSVLHIIAEGVLDIGAINDYAPKTPGIPVRPGEVLLSRINPRIPRALVVPDFGQPILCSSEFVVMRPKQGIDPYMIAFLLLSKGVQSQIQCLASGTSASHNRVKTKDLANVFLPIPRSGSESAKRLNRKLTKYQEAMKKMMEFQRSVSELRATEMGWLRPKQDSEAVGVLCRESSAAMAL